MKGEIIFSLIKAVVPSIADNFLKKLNLFRCFQIQLPEPVNSEELFSEIKKISEIYKDWKITQEVLKEKCFNVIFFNKNSILSINWTQTTIVFYKEINPKEKYLIIYSQFNKSQVAERGILMNNCNIVIEAVKNYFNQKGTDISQNISQAQFFEDNISKSVYGKNISTRKTILIVGLIVIIFILIFFFLINYTII